MQYIFGPLPSRRLGLSLGISPIPRKTCNYSCIYCQLGRTDHLTNKRELFFPVNVIIEELETTLAAKPAFDAATIVGEGEPTLYLGLGDLIEEVKARVDKPVAVITNGALVYLPEVRADLSKADIVLLSMDAYDQGSFQKINRPHGKIKFIDIYEGLKIFSEQYQGQLWLEIMLMNDNVDEESLGKYAQMLRELKYQKLYLNTPVRPPAEPDINPLEHEKMQKAVSILGGVSIDLIHSQGFHSEITDHYAAILSIIKRHPMNQFEIESFLKKRGCEDIEKIMDRLKQDRAVSELEYMGYLTYRLR